MWGFMDCILDRAQLAFVVGRETSNTCQGFRLKALSSLRSAACQKKKKLHKGSRPDTLQQQVQGGQAQ